MLKIKFSHHPTNTSSNLANVQGRGEPAQQSKCTKEPVKEFIFQEEKMIVLISRTFESVQPSELVQITSGMFQDMELSVRISLRSLFVLHS